MDNPSFKSSIVIALIFLMLLPSPRAFAAAPAVIAVVPVTDGEADEKSKGLAEAIGSALKVSTGYHIVDSDLAAQVIDYHDADSPDILPPDVREAEEALAGAKESFFKFRYDESERELSRAIALLEAKRPDISSTGPLLVDAYVARAVTAKSRGDSKAAHEALHSALRINPRLDLAAQEYPPSLVSIFEEERAELLAGPSGSIAVETKPEVADAYLNGLNLGVTPLVLDGIPAGSYSVGIRANKYVSIDRKVDVSAGAMTKVKESLRWSAKGKGSGGKKTDGEGAAAQVREGARIAELLKADKVVLVDADMPDGAERISARMIDRRFRAGHREIILDVDPKGDDRTQGIARMVGRISDEAAIDISKDPSRYVDPQGVGDPVLLGKRRHKFVGSPLFWAIVGAAAAGAIGGGIAAGLSGGGAGSSGNLRVQFR